MRNFAFDKTNYVLLAVGMVIILLGFFLMSGSGSSETAFNPDIFSDRRIKVAPVVCLFGFLFMTYGIMHKPKGVQEETETPNEGKETEV
ncbi:MAG: DUF3098 domain-containing protein [Bacteroidaceae bacterium]|nr:DUF3098 domain-containing protein [Bacteroidaceae bacterium]